MFRGERDAVFSLRKSKSWSTRSCTARDRSPTAWVENEGWIWRKQLKCLESSCVFVWISADGFFSTQVWRSWKDFFFFMLFSKGRTLSFQREVPMLCIQKVCFFKCWTDFYAFDWVFLRILLWFGARHWWDVNIFQCFLFAVSAKGCCRISNGIFNAHFYFFSPKLIREIEFIIQKNIPCRLLFEQPHFVEAELCGYFCSVKLHLRLRRVKNGTDLDDIIQKE